MPFNKPDFIGIGMRKCGTSWLYEQLREHPEIHMPAIKEVRFFYEGYFYKRHNLFTLFFSKHNNYRKLRKLLPERINRKTRARDPEAFKDYFNYYFKRHTTKWYFKYLNSSKISGEITPGYWELNEKKIASIKRETSQTLK